MQSIDGQASAAAAGGLLRRFAGMSATFPLRMTRAAVLSAGKTGCDNGGEHYQHSKAE